MMWRRAEGGWARMLGGARERRGNKGKPGQESSDEFRAKEEK